VHDNGETDLVYSYFGVQAHAENFIPIVGAFAQGYDTENTTASFKCNAAGVLVKMDYIGGGQGTGANVESVTQSRNDTRTAQ
jgi:hypothetical protein